MDTITFLYELILQHIGLIFKSERQQRLQSRNLVRRSDLFYGLYPPGIDLQAATVPSLDDAETSAK